MILRYSKTAAFSLAEVTIALSVAVFTLIAISGLLPIGLDSTRDAINQTAANNMISAIISDLRATAPAATSSDQFGIAIPTDPTNPAALSRASTTLFFNAVGSAVTDSNLDSRYRLEINFLRVDHAQAPLQAVLQVSWPAAATSEDAQGAVKVFCAFDRN